MATSLQLLWCVFFSRVRTYLRTTLTTSPQLAEVLGCCLHDGLASPEPFGRYAGAFGGSLRARIRRSSRSGYERANATAFRVFRSVEDADPSDQHPLPSARCLQGRRKIRRTCLPQAKGHLSGFPCHPLRTAGWAQRFQAYKLLTTMQPSHSGVLGCSKRLEVIQQHR